ncbi:MAG TPA: ABC transporter ATP-binding protein [Kiritimatiellia bacterium]|nr:ABC transporter ATP-binding protein [Kiritimatiellia bacterium]
MNSAPSTPIAIRCCNLVKGFGAVPAVRGVGLDVEAGRFLALLGPSGCGKTTMLRLIAGFESPEQGEIDVGGRRVAGPGLHLPPEQRRVGMVFQEYALFPHLDVAANTAYGLKGHPDPARRVEEVLALVGLRGVKNRLPHELSGGQQQRVALARALAPDPGVILLDEPFSNLDAALRQRVRTEIRHILREAGVTAIFVTHDQEEAFSLADHVAVMMDGRIVQTGTPERLYRRPDTHIIATFLGEANFLPGHADASGVQCELGLLELHHPARGDVEVMFRPEDLVMTADPSGPGVIIDRDYFGHDQILRIQLDSGTQLKSRMVGCCRGFREGQRVSVHVDTPVMAYPSRFGCPVAPAVEAKRETLIEE